MDKARELQDKHPCIGEVRGKGLFVGLELVKNRKTREPIFDPFYTGPQPTKQKILAKAFEEGVYCLPGQVSVIMLSPPLAITKDEIDHAMDVFDKALVIGDAETKN
jgi:taurine--2-oxoglutarate transaminase